MTSRHFIFKTRRISRLEIKRVMPSTDTGYYECRAMNAVAREPAVARTRVIVISGLVPAHTTTTSSSRHQVDQVTSTVASAQTSDAQSSSSSRGSGGDTSSRASSSSNMNNIFSPWYEHPCPRPHYCLNGGQCTYIKPLAEYYCR